jgi:glycosyltransferase involved in cell wall biosynthesis
MSGNKSLILCNRMNEVVYGDMLIDGYNCVMFSTVDEFFDKAEYYLNNEEERMKIVNTAHTVFKDRLTWLNRSKEIKSIIEGYRE